VCVIVSENVCKCVYFTEALRAQRSENTGIRGEVCVRVCVCVCACVCH